MNRSISVSTEVFAAIWARRQAGEETEDAILRRELKCSGNVAPIEVASPTSSGGNGVRDTRNGVDFAEGFEIFRNYKGQQYSAEARNGVWVRKDNGQQYPTLNQLNASIAAGAENVWNGNWKYRTSEGKVLSIGTLRR